MLTPIGRDLNEERGLISEWDIKKKDYGLDI